MNFLLILKRKQTALGLVIFGLIVLSVAVNPLAARGVFTSKQTITAIFLSFNLLEYDTNSDGRYDNIQVQFILSFTESHQDYVTVKISLMNLDLGKITTTKTRVYFVDSEESETSHTIDMEFVSNASYYEVRAERDQGAHLFIIGLITFGNFPGGINESFDGMFAGSGGPGECHVIGRIG